MVTITHFMWRQLVKCLFSKYFTEHKWGNGVDRHLFLLDIGNSKHCQTSLTCLIRLLGWAGQIGCRGEAAACLNKRSSDQAPVVTRRVREHKIWTLLSVFSCHQLTSNPGLNYTSQNLYTRWPYTRTLGTIASGAVQQLRHWFLVDFS